jgi:hypothetical protein
VLSHLRPVFVGERIVKVKAMSTDCIDYFGFESAPERCVGQLGGEGVQREGGEVEAQG